MKVFEGLETEAKPRFINPEDPHAGFLTYLEDSPALGGGLMVLETSKIKDHFINWLLIYVSISYAQYE